MYYAHYVSGYKISIMGSFNILKLLWNSKIFNNLEENVKGQGESKFQKNMFVIYCVKYWSESWRQQDWDGVPTLYGACHIVLFGGAAI